MKLLIIDDNTEITDMLKQFLEMADFDVTVTNNGKDGLGLIQSNDFDRVLLDIAMPEFSGLDVLENLKIHNFEYFHKIFILTASSLEKQNLDKIKLYGINSVIEKPVKMAELVEILRK